MVVGEFSVEVECAVIGAGPAGFTAAVRARALGLQVALIDRGPPGGGWVHGGALVSKDLLRLAEVVRAAKDAGDWGVAFDGPRIDPARMRGRLLARVAEHTAALELALAEADVQLVRGEARFESDRVIGTTDPETPRVRFRRAIVTTGSRPRPLPGHPFDGRRIVDPATALSLDPRPERVLVVGGSTVALEIGSILALLGAKVTLLDRAARLLEFLDPPLVEPLRAGLERTFERLVVGAEIDAIEDRGATGLRVAFSGPGAPPPAEYDAIVVAVGREPDLDGLAPEVAGVGLRDDGWIATDDGGRTSATRVLAAGDCTGPPLLAQKAVHQGRIAAEVAAGWNSAYDARAVPQVVYTDPPIAWCGMTEAEALRDRVPILVRETLWRRYGCDGVTRLIVEPDTELIVGMGVVGPGAPEIIAEGALAIEMGAVVEDLVAVARPRPTASETIGDALRLD